MKKAQGLSLNFMAIAVLILVVILVVLLVFGGGINELTPFFSEQTDCTARGGECDDNDCRSAGGSPLYGLGCTGSTAYCCIKQ